MRPQVGEILTWGAIFAKISCTGSLKLLKSSTTHRVLSCHIGSRNFYCLVFEKRSCKSSQIWLCLKLWRPFSPWPLSLVPRKNLYIDAKSKGKRILGILMALNRQKVGLLCAILLLPSRNAYFKDSRVINMSIIVEKWLQVDGRFALRANRILVRFFI